MHVLVICVGVLNMCMTCMQVPVHVCIIVCIQMSRQAVFLCVHIGTCVHMHRQVLYMCEYTVEMWGTCVQVSG